MKVIVLTGLVSIEKAQLSIQLATYSQEHALDVYIIDNIMRQAIPTETPHTMQRITEDILPDLDTLLSDIQADVTIIALSEQAHPEKLFVALDQLREQFPASDFHALAMIDTRTCDCFPNVRQALEMYADASIMLPYELDEVLTYVNIP